MYLRCIWEQTHWMHFLSHNTFARPIFLVCIVYINVCSLQSSSSPPLLVLLHFLAHFFHWLSISRVAKNCQQKYVSKRCILMIQIKWKHSTKYWSIMLLKSKNSANYLYYIIRIYRELTCLLMQKWLKRIENSASPRQKVCKSATEAKAEWFVVTSSH